MDDICEISYPCWSVHLFTVFIMLLATEEEVCILWNMFGEIKSIVFKIKILACLLLCRSFGNVVHNVAANSTGLLSASDIINLEKMLQEKK